MTLLHASCYVIPTPEPPPVLNLPNLGELRKAFSSIDKIPSPMDMLAGFMDLITPGLAPMRMMLEMTELQQAYYNCLKAIPEAILSLSADPILECLKNAAKAVGRILAWFPPMPYIKTGVGLARLSIDLIDAFTDVIVAMDRKAGQWATAHTLGVSLGDVELTGMMSCIGTELAAPLHAIMEGLLFIKPSNDLLLDPFIRLVTGGSEPLKQIKQKLTDADTFAGKMKTALQSGSTSFPEFPGSGGSAERSGTALPFLAALPPLGPLLLTMQMQRNALVLLYNLLAPFVGYDPDAQITLPPTLTYLA